jgi:hypothetical protein
MSSPISYDSLWAGFVTLDGKEQHKFFHAALKQLLGKPPRAAKKEPTGGAEPKERKTNWWTEATKRAMPLLKPVLEEVNENLVSGGFKKYRISCVTQFLGSLKEKGELSAEVFPTEEVLEARFKSFLIEYGKTHKDVAESDGEGVATAASAGSKGSKTSKFSELSPEEQKALRSTRAKKAAATRAAAKKTVEAADE